MSDVVRRILTMQRSTISVDDALDLWLAVAERIGVDGNEPVLPATLRKYRQAARDYIRPHFEGMTLCQVTAPAVARFRTWLLVTLPRPLATNTLSKLRSCLECCRLQGLISTNPARGIVIATRISEVDPLSLPSRDNARQMLAATDALVREAHPDRRRLAARDRAAIYLLRFTGLRIGELLGLAWPALDTWTHRLAISQMVDGEGRITDPKSRAGHRTLDVPPAMTRLLLEWQRDCPGSADRLMFPNTKRAPWIPSNFAKTAWKQASERAGLTRFDGRPAYTRHSFRDLYASELIAAGATIKEVQYILGHARATTTLRYYGRLFHDVESGGRRRYLIRRIADAGWPN